MAKYLIETVSVTKHQYIVEAYSEDEAIKNGPYQKPIATYELGHNIFGMRAINEYEYDHEWADIVNEGNSSLDDRLESTKERLKEKYLENYGGTNGDL